MWSSYTTAEWCLRALGQMSVLSSTFCSTPRRGEAQLSGALKHFGAGNATWAREGSVLHGIAIIRWTKPNQAALFWP